MPALPRHIKLRHDPARNRWMLLAPERVLMPDPIALDILHPCDGQRSVAAIAAALAGQYAAPRERILTRRDKPATRPRGQRGDQSVSCRCRAWHANCNGSRAPLGLLAELTHRCPLQCPYCSNPLDLERARDELSTDAWCDVLAQAAELGVLQLHLSGGSRRCGAIWHRSLRRRRALAFTRT